MKDKTFPCSFCGLENKTKSARRVHNKTCDKNVGRAVHRAMALNANKRYESMSKRHGWANNNAELLNIIAGDFSDGAYLAMAEEMGVSVEDFI